MELLEICQRKGFLVKETTGGLEINMGDFMVTINGNEIDIPIPLPTGRENLDQLVANGTMYARASRMAQTIGGPFTYRFEGDFVVVVKKFETREEAEASLTKAIESLETLRYFL